MPKNKRWFEFKNAADGKADVTIHGPIGGWGTSALEFKYQLDALNGADIRLHICSGGGGILDGNEMYNALKEYKGSIVVTLGSICASAATVVALGGDEIRMSKNGLFMIHNPSTFTDGDSEDHRKRADIMDKMKSIIIDIYNAKTGIGKDELSKMMDEETWLLSSEALEKKFVDSIIDDVEEDEESEAENSAMLSMYQNSAAAFSRLGKTQPKNSKEEGEQPMNRNNRFSRIFLSSDNGGGSGGGSPTPTAAQIEQQAQARAKELADKMFKDRMANDKEIDEIVLAVRKRDKKDFSEVAARFKNEGKSADAFARFIATSDEFKPHEVVGSGVDVVGVRGLDKGTPGELFVASADYRGLCDQIRNGSRKHASVLVQTQGFIAEAMNRFLNVTTSSGLTSIEKLPGVVALGVRQLTVKDLIAPGQTANTTIRYIREASFANGATTVAEGDTKPAASFSFEEVDAPVKKIAAYTKVTDELFADYLAVASFINMRLPYMVDRTEEDELLNGDGTGTHLTGIMNTTGIQTLAKGADTTVDALYKALTKVRWGNLAGAAQGGFEPDAYVIHPTDWEAIRLLKDGNNQYFAGGPFTGAYGNGGMVVGESLWGKPVVVTPAITQGTALAGAFRLGSQYFDRQGLTIESTNTDQDDFIKNLTTIRAERRLALAVYRPSAFCQVTGL